MSKIHHLYPNWLPKSALAHKLGVSERTIYARWKRGELLRQEVEGEILWAEIPEEGRKEAEEASSFLSPHAGSEVVEGRGSSSSSAFKKEPLEAKWVLLLEQKNSSLVQLEKEKSALQIELTRSQGALEQACRERDVLQRQNEALLRALEQRTLVQGLLLWLKGFWTRFTRP